MKDGRRLGRKDASILVENVDCGLDVPPLFTHLGPTIF
jgi:hypothetical protein